MKKLMLAIYIPVILAILACQTLVILSIVNQLTDIPAIQKVLDFVLMYPDVYSSLIFFGKVANVTILTLAVAFILLGISDILLKLIITFPLLTFICLAFAMTQFIKVPQCIAENALVVSVLKYAQLALDMAREYAAKGLLFAKQILAQAQHE